MYHLNKKWNKLSKNAKHLIRKVALNKYYKIKNSATEEQIKLKVSTLFKKILDKFTYLKINENYNVEPKITIYSAHDSNIIDIIQSIISYESLINKLNPSLDDDKLYNFLLPPFASNIVFELHKHKTNGNYFVQIYYNGQLIKNNFSFNKKEFNEGKIPFDDFKNILEYNMHKNINQVDCSDPLGN